MSEWSESMKNYINSTFSDNNVKEDLLKFQFQSAYDKASSDKDKDEVINVFLIGVSGRDWGWSATEEEQRIEPIKDVIYKWIKELGFRNTTNHYLKFIPGYYNITDNKSTILDNYDGIALNNLYANKVLDFGDIAGTSVDKLNHIIFNHNLYKNNQSDLEFIVKAYEALSSKSFVNNLNIEALKDLNDFSKQKLQDIKDKKNNGGDDAYVKAVRDSIIFRDSSNPQTSEIYAKNYIEDILSTVENTEKEKDDDIENLTPEKVVDMLKNYKNLSTADKKKVNDAFSLMR